ncbi:MAG: HD domain-containing protein [Clostridia bacterium]|nr:HD domain-containing protein [Clostridia bacterium]
MKDRLEKQLGFIYEIDRVKGIFRKTRLFHTDRFENDAEHSWHICMMALVLQEYANDKIDILKVLKMMLIHDLVEIDTGDTIVYNRTDADVEAEKKAADRIFGMLPGETGREFHDLWTEFETRESAEARFAGALDRLEPLLQNMSRNGEDWRRNGIGYEKVLDVNKRIADGSLLLWDFVRVEIKKHLDNGDFAKS